MIGNGWRINPALWSYIHYDTESLAQELWAICGWESLATGPGPSAAALLLETGDYLLLETGDYLLLEGDYGSGFTSPIFTLRFMGV